MSTSPPPSSDSTTYQRVRKAIMLMQRAYPGPAGKMLARELDAWLDVGYRFGDARLVTQVVDDVLARAERGEAA